MEERRIIEDPALASELIEKLIPFGESEDTLINAETGEKWVKYELMDSQTHERSWGLYKLPRPTTKELIEMIVNTRYSDEAEGAAGLLFQDEWHARKEFREELINALFRLYNADRSQETSHKIIEVIERARLIQKEHYFIDLSKRAEILLRRVKVPASVRKGGFSREIKDIITYTPEELRSFRLIMYEWIDNLNFTLNPKDYLSNADQFIAVAKELFLEAGWYGDGEIELMWIPPFMFDGIRTDEFTAGVIVWHVKQHEDGLSWILSPVKLPCERENSE